MKKTMMTLMLLTASAIVVSAANDKGGGKGKVEQKQATKENPAHPGKGKVGDNKKEKANCSDRYNQRNPVKGGQMKQKGKKTRNTEAKPEQTNPPVLTPAPKPGVSVPLPQPFPTPGTTPGATPGFPG